MDSEYFGAIVSTDRPRESTALETLAVILPSFLLTFLAVNVVNFLKIASRLKCFIVEFIIIAVTNLCDFTIFVPYIYEVLAGLLITNALICMWQEEPKKCSYKEENPDHHPYITNARSTINLLSIIAILAVDFYVFPRRFGKTSHYGYSLMDVGVGLFVYSNGIVSPEIKGRRNKFAKTVKSTLPLLFLGVARFVVTREIKYNVPEGEYGLHWNFFITLAVTKLTSSMILNFFNAKYALLPALILLIVHEASLQSGLAEFVFGNVPRDTFFTANREGIVSSLGYIALHLLSVSFGFYIYQRKIKFGFGLKLLGVSLVSLVVALVLQVIFGTSRRLANSAYCFWVFFIGVFMTTLYYLCELIHNRLHKKSKGVRKVPFIFEAINYNGLVFFLVSNFLTGFVNMSIRTYSMDYDMSMLILGLYLLTTCGFISVLYVRKIRLKL